MVMRVLLIVSALLILSPLLFLSPGSEAKEASLLRPQRSEKGEEGKGRVEADRLDMLEKGRILDATGNVYLTYGQILLRADHVRYDRQTEDALAEGKVFITDGKSRLEGERFEYNTGTGRGTLYKGNGFFSPSLWVRGMEIRREDENTYWLSHATLTPCPTQEDISPDWEIRTRETTVHLNADAISRDVTFRIKGVPVLYSPYFRSPAGERQSGFLIPQAGYSAKQGFFLKNAYFWAISPSQDATFSLNYRTKRGFEGGLEYRYILSEKSKGHFDGTYAYDEVDHKPRWKVAYRHEQEFRPDLNGKIDLNLQKTKSYQRIYSLDTNTRSQRLLTSEGYVAQTWPNETLMLWGNYTEDLKSPDHLYRLPELSLLSYRQPWERFPLYVHLNSSGTVFERRDARDVGRYDLYPRLTLPLNLAGLATFTPLAAVRETLYTREAEDHSSSSREVYQLQARLDSRISRVFQVAGKRIEKVEHVIEPMVAYEYIPEVHQGDLLQNDALDFISPQNGFTYSLTNRIRAKVKEEGETRQQELLLIRFSQTYNIHGPHQSFPFPELGVAYNDLRSGLGIRHSERRFSDINGHLVLSPLRLWSLEVDANYDPGGNHVDTLDPCLRFQFPRNASLAVGYHYSPYPELGIQAVDGKVDYKFREKMALTFVTRYDFNEDAFRENNIGVTYFGPCWSVTFGFMRRLRNGDYDNAFHFTFDLRTVSGLK